MSFDEALNTILKKLPETQAGKEIRSCFLSLPTNLKPFERFARYCAANDGASGKLIACIFESALAFGVSIEGEILVLRKAYQYIDPGQNAGVDLAVMELRLFLTGLIMGMESGLSFRQALYIICIEVLAVPGGLLSQLRLHLEPELIKQSKKSIWPDDIVNAIIKSSTGHPELESVANGLSCLITTGGNMILYLHEILSRIIVQRSSR
ncbi:MAG: hypothetical protein AABZ06_04025 [Bdellovibrionota bacterium]